MRKILNPCSKTAQYAMAAVIRHVLVFAAPVAVAIFFCPAPTIAQGTLRAVHGDWQVRCDIPPGAAAEQCAVAQDVTAEDRENVGLTVIVLKTADDGTTVMRVLAPLGVLLPSGLGLRIDETDVGNATFVRCTPVGCLSEVVLQRVLIDLMKTGETATFIIFQVPEEGIGIPISLNGFAAAFAEIE